MNGSHVQGASCDLLEPSCFVELQSREVKKQLPCACTVTGLRTESSNSLVNPGGS